MKGYRPFHAKILRKMIFENLMTIYYLNFIFVCMPYVIANHHIKIMGYDCTLLYWSLKNNVLLKKLFLNSYGKIG